MGLCQQPSAAISASACLRPPAAALVRQDRSCAVQHGIDHRPGGLDRVLAGEQRAVAGHRVAQQPLVGRFLAGLLIEQVELALVADELLARALDAGGEGDGRTGRQPEAQIIGPPGRRRRVVEQSLRRRLQLHQHLGRRLGQTFAGAQVPRHPLPAPRVDDKAAARRRSRRRSPSPRPAPCDSRRTGRAPRRSGFSGRMAWKTLAFSSCTAP